MLVVVEAAARAERQLTPGTADRTTLEKFFPLLPKAHLCSFFLLVPPETIERCCRRTGHKGGKGERNSRNWSLEKKFFPPFFYFRRCRLFSWFGRKWGGGGRDFPSVSLVTPRRVEKGREASPRRREGGLSCFSRPLDFRTNTLSPAKGRGIGGKDREEGEEGSGRGGGRRGEWDNNRIREKGLPGNPSLPPSHMSGEAERIRLTFFAPSSISFAGKSTFRLRDPKVQCQRRKKCCSHNSFPASFFWHGGRPCVHSLLSASVSLFLTLDFGGKRLRMSLSSRTASFSSFSFVGGS